MTSNVLIKNDKYFALPPDREMDVKELFHYIFSNALGRSYEKSQKPAIWTAKEFAHALNTILASNASINVRTVQGWIQPNARGGIGPKNILVIAQLLSCGDADAARLWRLKLYQANKIAKREAQLEVNEETAYCATNSPLYATLPIRALKLFTTGHLNLAVTVWVCTLTLLFLSYTINAHNIVYSPVDGIEKQVGLFWSASKPFEAVFIPIILISVAVFITHWEQEGCKAVRSSYSRESNHESWYRRVHSHSLAFWAIFVGSFLIIGALQWATVHLRTYLEGVNTNSVADWLTVSAFKPDTVNPIGALLVSIFTFVYNAFLYCIYYFAFLLVYIVSIDLPPETSLVLM